ncbi:MAG: ABC transporter permease [Thermosediminibacteraceae bacterium]|nr:ABC transporter permease [Thermosediminibacteraceae bacterium]
MRKFFDLLWTDIIKQKRSLVWPAAFLAPLITEALLFLDFYLRRDYILNRAAKEGLSAWQTLVLEHHLTALWFITLPMAVTVVCALLYHAEHASGGLRYTLSLPVGKGRLYLSKWCTGAIFLCLMLLLDALMLAAVGKIFRLPGGLDYQLIMRYIANQTVAAVGIMSLQMWLSAIAANVILPLAAGFIGITTSLFLAQDQNIARIIPYAHVLYTMPLPGENNRLALEGGIFFAAFFLVAGLLCFSKKDVTE